MRKIILLLTISLFTTYVNAQEYSKKLFTLGIGYLGETITHPGVLGQAEYQHPIAKRWSLPLRAEIGYYFHKRNHLATIAQLASGIRFHSSQRFYIGATGGIGGMMSWHHSDEGVFEVEDDGTVSKESNYAGLDLLLSSGFEFGYKLSNSPNRYLWLRPQYMWQKNVNTKSLGHVAFEIGYSFSFN